MILPVFHGKRVTAYEHIIEEEVLRETANWPEGREFKPSGAESTGAQCDSAHHVRRRAGRPGQARKVVPAMVTVGSFLHQLPSVVGRDLGRWSPGGYLAHYRRRFDAVIDSLIAQARSDPAFEERRDVLAFSCGPAARTASRSRIGISPTSC